MTKTSHKGAGSLAHQVRKQVRPWHKRLGVIGALFLLLLSITGVAINHSDGLSLGKAQVSQSWLLDYYGITAPAHAGRFGEFAVTDNLLWHDGKLLLEAKSTLLGATRRHNAIIAIDQGHLYLLSPDGTLQETQDSSVGLPTPIEALALEGSTTEASAQVWLRTDKGQYLADDELLEWRAATSLLPLNWLAPTPADSAVIDHARSAHLNWERVLLDLHSGRFFGPWAVWLWDLLALIFVLLSLSGLYIWWSQRPKKR
ncbi:PepSY domain-containing protein [Shewanella sp. JM162201]|uniref:PepSY domain-containing protein n=1 Tax=Shewanella jiangmenensis TaxID=2837387 RepID=A0ABS5V2S8_9GAMM|nr:PepSY-associated TM helix domain-containing protein [Shewanella jiangmenensis]MBT1444248.1 PepSY domain-containing protein [Shewanella jiangmenensis]